MAKKNAVDLDITINADGFDISGGTTSRTLTVTGGDATITGSGSAVITFPGSTSTLATLGLDQTFSAAQTITIPSAGNDVALTVNQNDTTNNPRGVSITNAGTGASLFIDPNGNTSVSNSVGGALLINTTDSTGSALVMYSNQASPAAGANMLSIWADNVGWTTDVVDITTDGEALSVFINNTNTTSGQNLHLQNAGTSGGSYNIKLTAPVPQIEFVESDQVSPAGKFELGVNADTFYVSGRNAADNSFEKFMDFFRLANGGGYALYGTTSGFTTVVPAAIASGTLTLPAADGTLATLGLEENIPLVFDAALSADGKYSGFVRAGTAGATLAFGDLCYLAAADSRWELADADAASTSGDVLLGMCVLAAASDGDPTTMLMIGFIRADTAFPTLTISAPAYVGTTAGDIQVAQPTGVDDVIRRVGFATTADELYFNPSSDYITHTG